MRSPADILDVLIICPARTAEVFTGFQRMSACKVDIVSDGLDRQSSIQITARQLSLHCRYGNIPCQLMILAIAEVLHDQHHHPISQVLPGVRELVLIGEGKLMLEQAMLLSGHGRKITLVRHRPSDACRRVVNHYLSRLRHTC
ncbi:hypothetical protein [Undibacterium umbellatum]|uniref:Uncharacterized protein n=1 Tax=Undibacterium umbellatum TaxID=2762300 RepID=A0ABR6Z8U0_9BURK|nr:hypothetical protein [Undibacterium umbellatum]MBC3908188.1 hypothetical protein [Undibacterium umbellatum]